MILAAIEQVECVAGCGSSNNNWVSWAVGGTGLLVALGSMLLAWRSSKASRRSADAARESLSVSQESLSISREEHEAFLKTLRARADFAVSLSPDGGVIESDSGQVELHWHVEIENTGDKPAKEVVVIFIAPRAVKGLTWLEEEGDALLSERGGARNVRDDLVDADGTTQPAQAITKITSHIGRFTKFSRVGGTVDLPAIVGESVVVPVRVKVGSDDLPEDVNYIEASTQLKLERVAPTPPPF